MAPTVVFLATSPVAGPWMLRHESSPVGWAGSAAPRRHSRTVSRHVAVQGLAQQVSWAFCGWACSGVVLPTL